jgi:SnoaL-like domain
MKTTALVQAWVAAVNARDVPGVMARSSRDVEVRGPRGVTRGQPHLRDWVERTGVHLVTERTFARGEWVVLAQHATWRDQAGLTIANGPLAHCFTVAGERVVLVARHGSLAGALKEAGLTEADEVLP